MTNRSIGAGKGKRGREVEASLRSKYAHFQTIQTLNNEGLERIAALQRDLRYAPPMRAILEDRVAGLCRGAEEMVLALERLTDRRFSGLVARVREQERAAGAFSASRQELQPRKYAAWLSDVGKEDGPTVGGKAAALGEIKNGMGLPVPDGYVLSVDAYWAFVGLPCWREIRDELDSLDPSDGDRLRSAARRLSAMVLAREVPRAVEVAIEQRARTPALADKGMAVRSSAVGEGGERTFAGQFLSLLNVPREGLLTAYRRVVASRFSERALLYRLTMGLSEVESPMAVLFLPTVRAKAAGILYTRNPLDPKSGDLWVTATWGLGLEIAGGGAPADRFVVSRGVTHTVLERHIEEKRRLLGLNPAGGVSRGVAGDEEAASPSLNTEDLQVLADWGVRLEKHFGKPQDVEWVLDEDDQLWIVQTRPLTLAAAGKGRTKIKIPPLCSGGIPVFPGRTSGTAYSVEFREDLEKAPKGAVVLLRRPNPDIIKVLPKVAGVIAEWGNATGHAAALLREFKTPSVFGMKGVFEAGVGGKPVSLDAGLCALYAGSHWPGVRPGSPPGKEGEKAGADPITSRLLTLNLVDPSAFGFRISGCKSTHDVLRFVHQKAVETMFAVNDAALEREGGRARRLLTPIPVNIYVVDLGGGFTEEDAGASSVTPLQIRSRPFRAVWAGISHPGVAWQRKMPPTLEGLASVVASSISSRPAQDRPLGDRSYLLVSEEHMNLNTRLAYHFALVDARLADDPVRNYVAFRFVGGGATRWRRDLRARFIETILLRYGFGVDRRGDLVNAWSKKARPRETARRLDILGRLIACTGQLDMYMTDGEAMAWFVEQFMAENYRFEGSPGSQAEEG